MLKKKSKIYVAGHEGMVGSAVIRLLKKKQYHNLITISKKKLDLTNQLKVNNFFKKNKIDFVILAAAKVGGIYACNLFKADFIYQNLMIQSNVINAAYNSGVKNLIFLGSSCIYPKTLNRPIREKDLLSNYLEKTNESYAIAKIAGIKMCESFNEQYKLNYKCLMPCNLYGENDNFDLKTSHFLPGIMHKIYQCKKKKIKQLKLFGDGQPLRELMYVDDLAEAIIHFMNIKSMESLINIGSGYEKKIKFYVNKIDKLIDGINIKIKFDNNLKMNGTKRKILDCSLAKKYGWKPKYSFEFGLQKTYEYFLKNIVT